ncbi:hypothetical protein XENOCAPTIV_000204, partial [Xenoophorus captivus]
PRWTCTKKSWVRVEVATTGHAGVGPRRVQTTPSAALLSAYPSHQDHVAPMVWTLLQPAHPRWK